MDDEIRKRLRWVQLYEELGNAGTVCLRCGISRPTLRKWWQRYQEHGLIGLQEENRRPKSSPTRKVQPEHEQLIAALRNANLVIDVFKMNCGACMILLYRHQLFIKCWIDLKSHI